MTEHEPLSVPNMADEYLVTQVLHPKIRETIDRINAHNDDVFSFAPAYKQTLVEEFNDDLVWASDDQEVVDKLTAWVDEYGVIHIGRDE